MLLSPHQCLPVPFFFLSCKNITLTAVGGNAEGGEEITKVATNLIIIFKNKQKPPRSIGTLSHDSTTRFLSVTFKRVLGVLRGNIISNHYHQQSGLTLSNLSLSALSFPSIQTTIKLFTLQL